MTLKSGHNFFSKKSSEYAACHKRKSLKSFITACSNYNFWMSTEAVNKYFSIFEIFNFFLFFINILTVFKISDLRTIIYSNI